MQVVTIELWPESYFELELEQTPFETDFGQSWKRHETS